MLQFHYGFVEDVDDVEKQGRVRVRIHGLHSPDINILPTDQLKWSRIANAANISSGSSGQGWSNTALEKGDLVVGFFLDGQMQQEFFVCFSISGVPANTSNPVFNNHSKTIGEPDLHKLAREDAKPFEQRESNRVDVSINGMQWKEPSSGYATKYPNNKVYGTTSGHIMEFDDTPENERVNIQHKSGSYHTMLPNGDVSKRAENSLYDVSKERYAHVEGIDSNSATSRQDAYVDWNSKVSGEYNITSSVMNLDGIINVTKSLASPTGMFEKVMCSSRMDADCKHALKANRLGAPMGLSTFSNNSKIASFNNPQQPVENISPSAEEPKTETWIKPNGEVMSKSDNGWTPTAQIQGLSGNENIVSKITNIANSGDVFIDNVNGVVKEFDSSLNEWIDSATLSIEKIVKPIEISLADTVKSLLDTGRYIKNLSSMIEKLTPIHDAITNIVENGDLLKNVDGEFQIKDIIKNEFNEIVSFSKIDVSGRLDELKLSRFGIDHVESLPDVKDYVDRFVSKNVDGVKTIFRSDGISWINL